VFGQSTITMPPVFLNFDGMGNLREFPQRGFLGFRNPKFHIPFSPFRRIYFRVLSSVGQSSENRRSKINVRENGHHSDRGQKDPMVGENK